MKRLMCLLMLLLTGGPLLGAVSVGDVPTLKTRAIDGTTVDLATLRGKYVIIDFWVGRSDLNRRNEQAMAGLYERYKKRGLEMIGICCDRRIGDAKRHIEELKIAWPQIHEPADWKGGLGAEWGVPQVNWCYLISPDGKVLYAGLPDKLEDALQSAMAKNPPRLVVPEVLEKAKNDLESVETLLADKDRDGAVRQFTRIPDDATKDPEFASQAAAMRTRINTVADELLNEVDQMLSNGQHVAASVRLRELLSVMAGLPTGSLARQRLAELVSHPAVQEQLKRDQTEEKAAAALAEARQLRDETREEDAYLRFKAVATDFPGTRAAEAARDAVQAYEADAAFLTRMKDRAAAPKAKPLLSLAENYLAAGKADLARKKYAEVVEQFPGTTFQRTAAQKLAELK